MLPSELEELIEQAAREEWEELNLSGSGLTELPSSIGKLKKLKKLILGNQEDYLTNPNVNKLNSLPIEISKLTNLEILDLSYNNISQIPEVISGLTNLKSLNIRDNSINKIPEWIAKCKRLVLIDISNNKIIEIPSSIETLVHLKFLFLGGNLITQISDSITNLRKLEYLILESNKITEIPNSIGRLTSLNFLFLSENLITNIPESIANLTNLQILQLQFNSISEIPKSISQLTNLISLKLGFNKIREIPEEITQLPVLFDLDFDDNPLLQPPLEVVENGIEAIRKYFQQIETEGVNYLYEAKLLIVGEGGAGKTSLANKIINPDYELRKEDSTKGIEIKQWKFPLDNGKTFTVNIWDFGGQEIYHATHQYFLTKRSLYALVADNRKEDTDFYYWLNVIELLSDNSPIAIIKNEIQKRKRDINFNQLRGEFGNLKDSFATNLADNSGLDKILENLKFYLKELPHIGSALPKTWVKVRTALESDPRNHITLNEYLQICKSNGFKQDKDSLQLSEYLHDLGICLHFQDDKTSSLYKTVILKPKWGTESAYAVLDHPKVIDKKGHFSHQDLDQIWCADDYAGMQPELLQLMMKFQLCYEIPLAKGNYIAPQLLSENQPDYTWDESDNLILRYTYDLMPKGLVRQFIVAMHQDIEAQNVWRTGVIINAQNISNTRAEIIESYGKREIKIRISGKNKRDLLTVVTRELDKIHDLYPRFKASKEKKESKEKYQKLVPCNCNTCKGNQNPHFYPYATLQEFLSDRQLEIQCQKKPYNMVNVCNLLDDIGEIGKNERQILREPEWQNSNNDKNFIEFNPQINFQPQITIQQQQQQGGAMDNQQQQQSNSEKSQQQQIIQEQKPINRQNVEAVSKILELMIYVIGIVSVLSVIGGIVAIIYNSKSPSEISMFSQKISTGHVGVAFVFIGIIGMIFSFRKLLNTLSNIANPKSNRAKKRKKRK